MTLKISPILKHFTFIATLFTFLTISLNFQLSKNLKISQFMEILWLRSTISDSLSLASSLNSKNSTLSLLAKRKKTMQSLFDLSLKNSQNLKFSFNRQAKKDLNNNKKNNDNNLSDIFYSFQKFILFAKSKFFYF